MKPRFELKKSLYLMLIAALAAGSGNLVASPDDDDDDDRPGQGGGGNGGGNGGGGQGGDGSDALTSDFAPLPGVAGRGDGHYFPFAGDDNTALNADVRLALGKVGEDDEPDDYTILVPLNTHLGIDDSNYQDAVITLFIGTDEDGDGNCLSEGPTSICVFKTGGGHDLMINDDNILHAAWALALREEDGDLREGGTGICWTDFDSTEVIPQITDGVMTSVIFNIEGGEQEMPEISDGDGCMVGYGHRDPTVDLGFTTGLDCGPDMSCEVIPIMMGTWED